MTKYYWEIALDNDGSSTFNVYTTSSEMGENVHDNITISDQAFVQFSWGKVGVRRKHL